MIALILVMFMWWLVATSTPGNQRDEFAILVALITLMVIVIELTFYTAWIEMLTK